MVLLVSGVDLFFCFVVPAVVLYPGPFLLCCGWFGAGPRLGLLCFGECPFGESLLFAGVAPLQRCARFGAASRLCYSVVACSLQVGFAVCVGLRFHAVVPGLRCRWCRLGPRSRPRVMLLSSVTVFDGRGFLYCRLLDLCRI